MDDSNPGIKTALITGGAVGIGKGIALVLASRGYDLAISHYDELEQSVEVAETIAREYGRTCHVFQSDLTDAEAPARLVEDAAMKLGRLDVAVNNAGLTKHGSMTEWKLADFDYLVNLNFRAPMLVMQAVAKHMIERRIRGSIVNITSTRSERAYPGDAIYGGTKAALARATQSAALDLAPHGIRVALVRSIRQTGQGLGASSSVSRTTQLECQFICLIPRRCPVLASSTWVAYSVENQHIRSSSDLEN